MSSPDVRELVGLPWVKGQNSELPHGVRALLDTESATRRLSAAGLSIIGAAPNYLRHKPGDTTIVGFRLDVGEGTEQLGYARWCAVPDRATDIYEKAESLAPRMSKVGVGVAKLDDHTVFYGFPNDARLRRLRWYTTARKLKRVMTPLVPSGGQISGSSSTSAVLKYKPERRVVARVDLANTDGSSQRLLVRYTRTPDGPRLAAVASALLANSVSTPSPRAQLEGGHVSVDDFIDGVELRSVLLGGGSIVEHLARSLRSFHSTRPPVGMPFRTEVDDVANAMAGLSVLARWERDLGPLTRQVCDLLLAKVPSATTPRLIHGDLHDKNILVDNGRPWFIDLERAAVGSPASDLGRLRAHALALDMRHPGSPPVATSHADAVIDAYRSDRLLSAGERPDDRTLAWHCAIALVDQALLVTRQIEPEWRRDASELLAAAYSALLPRTATKLRADRR